MKKLLFTLAFVAFIPVGANAQNVSKGDVQRLNLDSITLDSTTVTATGAELNRAADVSARNVVLTGNAETLTETAHDGKLIYVSASGGNQAITLPDGGADTGAVFTLVVGDDGPSGDYAVTVAVPAGDNSTFAGSVLMANETDTIVYVSAATVGGTDTLTFNSANTEQGDVIRIFSADDSLFAIDGSVRFESVGEDSVLIFSSAVTSTD